MKLTAVLVSAAAAAFLAAPTHAARINGYAVNDLADRKVGATKQELRAQVKHSRDVIRFFTVGAGYWRSELLSCRPVIGQTYGPCARARSIVKGHAWLLTVADRRLARLLDDERREREAARLLARARADPWAAIDVVFGRYAGQAHAVASCESGHSTTAQNGQYLGIFQMGSSERATYGHGHDALTQAQAAYRYFAASGFDWSPWECSPW